MATDARYREAGALRCRVTENASGMRVWTSERVRRVRTGHGTGHPITYGDRIRVTFNMAGRQPVIFSCTDMSDMTEVLGEVRRRTSGLTGLGHLWVCNDTEGWKISRPLRLAPTSLFSNQGLYRSLL